MEADQSEKEAVMAAVNKRLPELEKWISRPEWKILEETNEYKLYYLDEESGLRSIKSEIIIEKPMKVIYDYICDISTKVNYDHSFECGQDVTKFDDHYYLQYYKYKGKLMFSPRDFFVANYRTYSEDFCELFGTNFTSDNVNTLGLDISSVTGNKYLNCGIIHGESFAIMGTVNEWWLE